MNISYIKNNYKTYIDTNDEIEVIGLIITIRKQKDFNFIKLNDGSNFEGIQLIFDGTIDTTQLYTGTRILAKGLLITSPGKNQLYEISVNKLDIIGNVNPDEYPLSKSKLGLLFLRDNLHLRFRTLLFGSIFRIRGNLNFATHLFFHNNKYLQLDPNIITNNECESGAGVFQLVEKDLIDKKILYDNKKDHFNKSVYLTVSSQLQLEAISSALGPVYTMNKSFRAEHSNTNKHLSEFTHLEIENTNINLEYLMDLGENYIKYVINYILENNSEDIENLNKFSGNILIERLKKLYNIPFKRISYDEAINILGDKITYGEDLSSNCENYLTEYFDNAVYVYNWPCSIKSFYMKQNDDNITCANFDLLMPYKVGELIGGSLREDNYNKLITMMKIKGIEPDTLKFYTDLRKFGSIISGGFGLGFDRILMLICGMENIRDVIPFPVSYGDCSY
jgi:asparaginyl-tRNA synthetase